MGECEALEDAPGRRTSASSAFYVAISRFLNGFITVNAAFALLSGSNEHSLKVANEKKKSCTLRKDFRHYFTLLVPTGEQHYGRFNTWMKHEYLQILGDYSASTCVPCSTAWGRVKGTSGF